MTGKRVKNKKNVASIDDYLNKIEAEYLSSKIRQRSSIKGLKSRPDVIDIGSAASMHLFDKKSMPNLLDKINIFQKIEQYPSVISTENNLEEAISKMFQGNINKKIDPKSIVIFRGIYDSYGQILLSSKKRTLIVPE